VRRRPGSSGARCIGRLLRAPPRHRRKIRRLRRWSFRTATTRARSGIDHRRSAARRASERCSIQPQLSLRRRRRQHPAAGRGRRRLARAVRFERGAAGLPRGAAREVHHLQRGARPSLYRPAFDVRHHQSRGPASLALPRVDVSGTRTRASAILVGQTRSALLPVEAGEWSALHAFRQGAPHRRRGGGRFRRGRGLRGHEAQRDRRHRHRREVCDHDAHAVAGRSGRELRLRRHVRRRRFLSEHLATEEHFRSGIRQVHVSRRRPALFGGGGRSGRGVQAPGSLASQASDRRVVRIRATGAGSCTASTWPVP
jgi:hypothetical protein